MTLPTGPQTRAAPIRVSTWNAEAWTFDLILSAGSAVERGGYVEVLDISGATWPDTIALLDSHRTGSLEDNLGEVANIRREGSELVGTARLSKHSPKAIRLAAELSDGHTFSGSIGYAVEKWSETKPAGKRTLTAKTWRIREASLVSVPADESSKIRSSDLTTTTDAPTTLTRAQLNLEIRSIAKTTGLDQAWIDAQTDSADDLDAVRAAALTAMQARTTAAGDVRSTHNSETTDNPEVRIRAMGEAMFARTMPSHKISDQARQYVGLTTIDLARETLRHASVNTVGLQPSTIIERALMTTSDFPLVFADTVGRQLKDAYTAAPSGVRQLARQSTARDFRPKSVIAIANNFELEKVNEHGEFKSGSLVESAESYKIDTFGKIIGVTRQMLVNDDIGAFQDLSARLGQAAAAFEAKFLVNMILSNPAMTSDNKAVFHADHGNLGTPAALSETSVSAARIALRKQTDVGANLISVTPAYLLVGPELETTAEKFLAEITAATTDTTNVFSGKLTLIVDPRITGKQWYVTASPSEVPSLEYSYLAGEPGPQVVQEIGFDVDGLRFRVREDFGAGWLDYRGWYKNAGV